MGGTKMTYTYRRILFLVWVPLVFSMTACSDQSQVLAPRAPSAELVVPDPIINHLGREGQSESDTVSIEDWKKKRMGLLILLLMGAGE